MTPTSLALTLLAGLSSCAGNLSLKESRESLAPGAGLIAQSLSPWFLCGLFFYAVNVVLFARALDSAPVSVAYPILATTGFALLAVTSAWLFGERLSPLQMIGLAVAVLGIALLAVG